jgi:hypothetical protein
MISEAELSRAQDGIFREASNLKEQLHSRLVQIQEMLRDNSEEIFNEEMIEDLVDLEVSITEALEGENKLEMLSSLNGAAKETIKQASKLINQEVASKIK